MLRTPAAAAAFIVLCVPLALPAQALEPDPSRLYGRVETTDGSLYEGFIRWGKQEAGWYDVLHASKPIPERNRRDAERLGWEPEKKRNRLEIFGIGITISEDAVGIGSSSQSGVRFGHISSLEVMGPSRARLLLKSGQELELRGGGDLGSSVGDILVEDLRRGQVELDWEDVRVIDFRAAPAVASMWGERLYGTLSTRSGERFTGYIVWDMDEAFTTEILDGEAEGRERDIPFGRIRAIERIESSSSRVHLLEGGSVVLRGTNDVNDGNRDILVADPSLGEVRVEWEQFHRLEFTPSPATADLSSFGRSGRLHGTVRARVGETHTGWIRWDNDEEYGWEILDGEILDGVAVDIELGAVRSMERVAYDATSVTLRDGRTFRLTGGNDVDEGNRGVYVERSDGTLVLVPWDRFESVLFDR